MISARTCVRATTELTANKKIDVSRDTGIGRWNQEIGGHLRHALMLYILIALILNVLYGIAWRDFYNHVLALFPRVSMGRPFQEKMADVVWESENRDAHLQAWKEGRTGVPIVDAGMRQANKMGWMHNRVRMIAAMYLTKDLMIDWRLGEKVSCVPTFPGNGDLMEGRASISWRLSSTETWRQTTAAGSGARALESAPPPTLESSIRRRRATRYVGSQRRPPSRHPCSRFRVPEL